MDRNKYEFICEECGNIKLLHASQIKTRRFCDRKCFNAYKKKHPDDFEKKGSIQKKTKDQNREFSDMTLTLVADNELRGKPVIEIADLCHWDLPRFMQQMEVNRERIDKRKGYIIARQKRSLALAKERSGRRYYDKFSTPHLGQRIDKT